MKQISTTKVIHVTPKGLEKLQSELAYLRIERRKEITVFLQETQGDIDDFEYFMAMDAQAFVEGRIQQLEKLLNRVEVLEPGQNNNGIVDLGSTVVLRKGDICLETYTIVGAAEADPEKGYISNKSPLGEALLGSRVGDDLEIKAPAGLLNFRVLAVQ